LNHARDVFRMWDPDTKRVHLSRDIVWTERMYFDSMQKCLKELLYIQFLKIRTRMKSTIEQTMKRKKNYDFEEKKINKVSNDNESNNQIKTQSCQIIKNPERYQNDLGATNVDELVDFETEKLLVGAEIREGIRNTGGLQSVKYNEAISGPEKEKWKKAIVDEHDTMIQNAV
jgi:hypothetical protein